MAAGDPRRGAAGARTRATGGARRRRHLEPAAYRQIFEHSLDGVLLTAPDGSVLAANPAACGILQLSEKAICRRGRDGIADPDDRSWDVALAERGRSGAVHARLRLRRGDGRTFPAELSSSVFLDERGRSRTCVIFRDVSGAEEAELHVRAIGELTQALLAGTELGSVLAMTARHARRLVGASVAWVTRLTEDGTAVDVVAGDGEVAGRLVGRRFPLASTPTARAIAAGGAVFVADLAREEGAVGAVRRLALGPTLVVPLRSATRSFGSLVVAAEEGAHAFDEESLGVAQLYADPAAVALALGEARADLERRTLDVLQRVTLPDRLPSVAGVSFAARYEPARRADRVSGDWYDALDRRDGTVALVIGDVAGHGLESAALTAQVRNTLRAHLLDGAGPGSALAKVDAAFEALRGDTGVPFVTVTVATLEAGRRQMTYALAGHLPPVLAAAGRAHWLEVLSPGPPLGVIAGGRLLWRGDGEPRGGHHGRPRHRRARRAPGRIARRGDGPGQRRPRQPALGGRHRGDRRRPHGRARWRERRRSLRPAVPARAVRSLPRRSPQAFARSSSPGWSALSSPTRKLSGGAAIV